MYVQHAIEALDTDPFNGDGRVLFLLGFKSLYLYLVAAGVPIISFDKIRHQKLRFDC